MKLSSWFSYKSPNLGQVPPLLGDLVNVPAVQPPASLQLWLKQAGRDAAVMRCSPPPLHRFIITSTDVVKSKTESLAALQLLASGEGAAAARSAVGNRGLFGSTASQFAPTGCDGGTLHSWSSLSKSHHRSRGRGVGRCPLFQGSSFARILSALERSLWPMDFSGIHKLIWPTLSELGKRSWWGRGSRKILLIFTTKLWL